MPLWMLCRQVAVFPHCDPNLRSIVFTGLSVFWTQSMPTQNNPNPVSLVGAGFGLFVLDRREAAGLLLGLAFQMPGLDHRGLGIYGLPGTGFLFFLFHRLHLGASLHPFAEKNQDPADGTLEFFV